MTEVSKSELRRLIREEGAPAAYAALMRVLQDPHASSTSLSGAARTMMDLTGFMKEADKPPKQPHEMTRDELVTSVHESQMERQARLNARAAELDARQEYLQAVEDDLNRRLAEIGDPPVQGVFD